MSGLQEQINKLETLVEDLTDKKHKMYEEKNQLKKKITVLWQKDISR